MKFFPFKSFIILLLFLFPGEIYLFLTYYSLDKNLKFSKIVVNTASDFRKLMVKESLRNYSYVFDKQ